MRYNIHRKKSALKFWFWAVDHEIWILKHNVCVCMCDTNHSLLTGHSRRGRKVEGARWTRASRKTSRLRVSPPWMYLLCFNAFSSRKRGEREKKKKEDVTSKRKKKEKAEKKRDFFRDNPEVRIRRERASWSFLIGTPNLRGQASDWVLETTLSNLQNSHRCV